jgi:catechol 2,3-dioxygenase-like lactoylglutathione lyase family enzyme
MPPDTEPVLKALLQTELLVSDLPTARTFYESVLGLTPLPDRPALPYAREWYALMDISNAAMFRYQITGLIVLWSKGRHSFAVWFTDTNGEAAQKQLC